MSWALTGINRLWRLRCPPGWKLTRAVSEGLDARVEGHLARCPTCAAEYQSLHALAAKAQAAFPAPEKMPRDAREAMGARLRASASLLGAQPHRRAFRWLAIPVAAGAAVLIAWGIRHATAPRLGAETALATAGESRASIRAIGQARFTRAQFQPDEIVRVDDGEIELEIAPLRASERFRVLTEDGEIEVRGTSFKVSVSHRTLTAVHVWRGRVEVRSQGGVFAVLEAGDDWVRSTAAPATPPGLEPAAVAAPAAPPPSVASTSSGTSTSSASPASYASPASSAARPGRRGATNVVASRVQPTPLHHPKAVKTYRVVSPAAPSPEPSASRDDRPFISTATFGHAWSLLRAGDAKRAAVEFGEVQRLARGRDIEEDALYWQAVAVGRTGDSAGARRLFGEFLDRFPRSSRAGEAAAAAGWLLLEAKEPHAARRAFERAALDPSPRVQASAQEGLRRTQEEDR